MENIDLSQRLNRTVKLDEAIDLYLKMLKKVAEINDKKNNEAKSIQLNINFSNNKTETKCT